MQIPEATGLDRGGSRYSPLPRKSGDPFPSRRTDRDNIEIVLELVDVLKHGAPRNVSIDDVGSSFQALQQTRVRGCRARLMAVV